MQDRTLQRSVLIWASNVGVCCQLAHLPEELQRAHKRPRPHLPSVHVSPLVQQQWEVPVALHPLHTQKNTHTLFAPDGQNMWVVQQNLQTLVSCTGA